MKGKKILVIEPDFESLKSLSRFLLDAKFEVITAYDGEEGLEKAKAENPDLVILEPRLPKMNGFDLCSIIAKDFERKIPVIILTEFFQDFKTEILQSFGAAGFLSKPFEKEKLFYKILDLLKESDEKKMAEETYSSDQTLKPSPQILREKSQLKSKNNGGDGSHDSSGPNGKNGRKNGYYRQIENLLASFKSEAGQDMMPSRDNRGNGSQKNNGQESLERLQVDDMLEEVLSEFGLTSKKKTSLEEDIRALNELIASC